ncbi:MAG: hypothetical protein AAB477_00020 [Patescibacteria group bacterium]
MKSIKLFSVAILAALFSTSCNKNNTIGGGVGLQLGPVSIVLTWGNTGQSGYYYGGLPSYGTDYFIGYISARPLDPNNIPITTANGVPFCTASCTQAQWQDANHFFSLAQSATYPPRRPVLIRIQWNTMTLAPNAYYLVAF